MSGAGRRLRKRVSEWLIKVPPVNLTPSSPSIEGVACGCFQGPHSHTPQAHCQPCHSSKRKHNQRDSATVTNAAAAFTPDKHKAPPSLTHTFTINGSNDFITFAPNSL
ncbi:hypothetical protein E2C01_053025 [Portunus trituberculatus]|uniref:Uncharacterized protein n=1 Tax=Portunus trituberculatus TaxID=210409 RepID=A0A5B7GFB8_PORTR|nr:hypothetical protein [Portunus trituberculatus]